MDFFSFSAPHWERLFTWTSSALSESPFVYLPMSNSEGWRFSREANSTVGLCRPFKDGEVSSIHWRSRLEVAYYTFLWRRNAWLDKLQWGMAWTSCWVSDSWVVPPRTSNSLCHARSREFVLTSTPPCLLWPLQTLSRSLRLLCPVSCQKM